MTPIQLDRHLVRRGVTAADVAAVSPRRMGSARRAYGHDRNSWFICLTEPRANAKARRSGEMGYAQWMQMLEADRVDIERDLPGNPKLTIITCPHATHGDGGCAEVCITHTGRAIHNPAPIRAARARRVQWLHEDPESYLAQLNIEINRAIRMGERMNLRPLFRLNGTSDIRWEVAAPWLFAEFGSQLFLDYTKWPPNHRRFPENYTVAWSAQAHLHTPDDWDRAIQAGMSVSIIADYPAMLVAQRPDLFVDATGSDAWMLQHRDNPRVGALKPLRPMTNAHPSVYLAKDLVG